jgi:hypothetical protein
MEIKTKRNREDKIWFIYKGKALEKTITSIQVSIHKGINNTEKIEILYFVNLNENTTEENKYETKVIAEEDTFTTKQELLDSI